MHHYRAFPVWGAIVLYLAFGFCQADADIIVTDWELTTAAADNYDPSSFDTITHGTVGFPFQETHTALSGPTSAQSSYDFTLSGNSATFNFALGLARSPSESRALDSGWIDFITTEPVSYSIDGGLAMSGIGNLTLQVVLFEMAYPNPHLYIASHISRSTPNESFELGVPGGDLWWEETGNLSGMLVPNVAYELFYFYELTNFPVTDSVATAQGDFSFALTPEPSSLALLALGGLILMKKRR